MKRAHQRARRQVSDWDRFQQLYWGSVARDYDSFYRSDWCQRENLALQRALSDLLDDTPAGLVLDLGCGSGQVHALLQQTHHLVEYVGVDISTGMMGNGSAPKGRIVRGAMDKLSFTTDGAVTCVVAAFSSASYAEDVGDMLAEIERVLRPGGTAHLSFLAPFGLSRLHHRSWSGTVYRTRGDRRSWAAAPAHRRGPRQLRRAVSAAGLHVVAITGVNVFSGVIERPSLWRIGAAAARHVPALSHTIELTIGKPVP